MITLYYIEKSRPYTVRVSVFFDHNLTELETAIKRSSMVYTTNDKNYIVEYMATAFNVKVDVSVYHIYNYLLDKHRSTILTNKKRNTAQHSATQRNTGLDWTGQEWIGLD